jgi:glutamine amidotransferase
MTCIVGYGLGNIHAFMNVFKRLDIPVYVAKEARDLDNATNLILPGVGAFDYAMKRLDASGMRGKLDELVLERKKPILGICVGMQMLAGASEEGSLPGLGYIDGVVKKFSSTKNDPNIQLPHMGWNNVLPKNDSKLFKGIGSDALFYFLHSYYFCCGNMENELASTEYGIRFASAVYAGNVHGVQFHPEKSHKSGIRLLQNFAEITTC